MFKLHESSWSGNYCCAKCFPVKFIHSWLSFAVVSVSKVSKNKIINLIKICIKAYQMTRIKLKSLQLKSVDQMQKGNGSDIISIPLFLLSPFVSDNNMKLIYCFFSCGKKCARLEETPIKKDVSAHSTDVNGINAHLEIAILPSLRFECWRN